jgi:hypothetical protein
MAAAPHQMASNLTLANDLVFIANRWEAGNYQQGGAKMENTFFHCFPAFFTSRRVKV